MLIFSVSREMYTFCFWALHLTQVVATGYSKTSLGLFFSSDLQAPVSIHCGMDPCEM